MDELDLLSNPSTLNPYFGALEVELITDSSVVQSKNAEKFLSLFKSMIEKNSSELL